MSKRYRVHVMATCTLSVFTNVYAKSEAAAKAQAKVTAAGQIDNGDAEISTLECIKTRIESVEEQS